VSGIVLCVATATGDVMVAPAIAPEVDIEADVVVVVAAGTVVC
jgi:hypothetical protein